MIQTKIKVIKFWITKFFEDLQTSKGTVEIPAFIECENLMKKLKINTENPDIVNFYYNKLKHKKI